MATVGAIAVSVMAATPPTSAEVQFRPAVRGPLGVVATTSPLASKAALDILSQGGNAVDAAVAAVFTVGVVRPEMCGIGGGGFLVYRGADGEIASLDFRELSPAVGYKFRHEMRVPNSAAGVEVEQAGGLATQSGHGIVGVPGTVKGMSAALARYGRRSLAETLAPAIGHAANGFPVSQATSDAMVWRETDLSLFPESSRTYLKSEPSYQPGPPPVGILGTGVRRAYKPGETLVLREYAETLKRIAAHGENEFYDPEGKGTYLTARLLAEEMTRPSPYAAAGDVSEMTATDLSSYRAIWRTPVVTKYRGHEVIGMPAPSSGGTAVAEMLNTLEGYDLAATGRLSTDHLHLLLEAQKVAWVDRAAYLGDPDKVLIPPQLTTKSYAEQRRGDISLGEARYPAPGGPFQGYREPWIDPGAGPQGGHTTHVSVIDADGNAVAVTCSIELPMGSAVVPAGLGFLLNGQLTDFTCSRVESTDPCDPTSPNAPESAKRPRSSMSPTIVTRQGEPLLVVGGAGGPTIIMGVLQAVVNAVDFRLDPAEALDAPRVDCCGFHRDGVVMIEGGRLANTVVDALAARGHGLASVGGYADYPELQAAGVEIRTNERHAASDPRDECGAAAHAADGRQIVFQCGP
jgi:gamma-glutamyltranspeptidase/glutathione hydrolase